jgi:hypothetical protein|nr:MAG TPA: hypothetical protein [Caudoviricetes sp.]
MFIIPAILAILNVILIAICIYKDVVSRKHAVADCLKAADRLKELKGRVAKDWYNQPKSKKD